MAAVSSATDVETIRFWNTNRVFANQGQCSAVFFFDSGMQSIENLQVSFSAQNTSGENVATGTLEVDSFGNGSADRYADAFAESEHFCDDDLTIVVDQATAIIEGRKVDLLAQKALVPEDFKPFKIHTTSARHTTTSQSGTLTVVPKAGLVPKEISIHGPEDDDFNGYGCPYRITPAPGTNVQPGSTVTFRSAWEAG
ncbi:IrmA family protein [Allochromatium humboldtianum]|uniref:IrmA family protein n=1 Tax=Allochromatium humboldtianum TaxID=504901 RepID=UPI001FE302E5|nr:IrmA family protein [Allochromatium humboldtianum]